MQLDELEIDGGSFFLRKEKLVEPVAAKVIEHSCQCVIVYTEDDEQVHSTCDRKVSGSDIPFCGECEERHPEYSKSHPEWTITVRPLPKPR